MSCSIAKTASLDAASTNRFVAYTLLAVLFYALAMAQAYAVATPMGFVICTIVGFIYGNLGRGLATLAVMIVGAGACLGKVSWGLAITVAIGISIIFNAGDIVLALTGIPGC